MARAPEREQRIVIRWRSRGRAERMRTTLDQAYPIEKDPCFDKVLKAIDDAERQVWSGGVPEGDADD